MFDGCIYFNTAALARQLERKWAAAYAPFGLSAPQGFMLRAVLERPGAAPNAISDALSIARPTATRLLDGLEAKGFITRHAAASDGRGQEIHPTKDALGVRDALNHASLQVTSQIKKSIGESTFAETVAGVRKARAALD